MPRMHAGALSRGHSGATTATSAAASDELFPPAWPPSIAVLSGVSAQAALALFHAPAVLAFAIAVFAFAFPSGLSACLLALALAQMLIVPRTYPQPLTQQAGALLLLAAAWFCVSYSVSAAGAAPALPAAVRAMLCVTAARAEQLGAFAPAATTASFAFLTLAVAAHARAHRAGPLWPSIHAQRAASRTAAAAPLPPAQLRSGAAVAAALALHTLGNAAVPTLWFALGLFRLCPAGTFYAIGPALETLPYQLFPRLQVRATLAPTCLDTRGDLRVKLRLYRHVDTEAGVPALAHPARPRLRIARCMPR